MHPAPPSIELANLAGADPVFLNQSVFRVSVMDSLVQTLKKHDNTISNNLLPVFRYLSSGNPEYPTNKNDYWTTQSPEQVARAELVALDKKYARKEIKEGQRGRFAALELHDIVEEDEGEDDEDDDGHPQKEKAVVGGELEQQQKKDEEMLGKKEAEEEEKNAISQGALTSATDADSKKSAKKSKNQRQKERKKEKKKEKKLQGQGEGQSASEQQEEPPKMEEEEQQLRMRLRGLGRWGLNSLVQASTLIASSSGLVQWP
ncbi:hypothetical protein BJ508DRAFT_304220 [Ascobolus immersus RN42]|uniref:Uncharacterized protein n=1 Tax=Ascobolus immersus RN42 TaxID=1160509 RepID=A0A3N4ID57_ASCIM|nr:hypothetical protein BJ508DRAFT_304220 [Ascobolus immersus RN42]